MDKQDPVEKYTTLLSSSKFLFIVYFRGHWCPFCRSYLSTLAALAPSITAAGGKPLIITAEPEEHLPATRKATGYEGEAIVDPENVLVKYFKERDLLDVAVTERKGYANGMAQPAVLVIAEDGAVLEKWAIVPSVMNLNGAKDRPELEQVWENAQAKLDGKGKVHRGYKSIGIWRVIKSAFFS